MLHDLSDALFAGAALASVPFSFVLGRLIGRRRASTAPAVERCAGYPNEDTDAFGHRKMNHDCEGLRDPMCSDGRCSFHCGRACKCSASNDPEIIGRRRA